MQKIIVFNEEDIGFKHTVLLEAVSWSYSTMVRSFIL